MGCLWASRVKAESSSNSDCTSGYKSRNPKEQGCGSTGGSCSKDSVASLPLTLRSEEEIIQSSKLKQFTYNTLRTATRNFRPDSVLGVGGFGSVFKGWIDEHSFSASKPGTGMVIAVKKLNQDGFQGHQEWLAEVNYLGQFEHINIVKLVGYCVEDTHRLLVYEFMPRGSLENHLFKRGPYYSSLTWDLRMRIALDAAKGLAFLHDPRRKVIYRDFKTSNILLDSNYVAKLSDFGLAKDGPLGSQSYISTRVMGTNGYAAPEYLSTGHVSIRSDVYSYGVVLLEMLCGRKVFDENRPFGERDLVEWAKPYLRRKNKISHILDPRLEDNYPPGGPQMIATLALGCLLSDPKKRPTMDEVVKILEQLKDSTDDCGGKLQSSRNRIPHRSIASSHRFRRARRNLQH